MTGWKWAVLGVFGGAACIGAIVSLIMGPESGEPWGAVAILALFAPITAIAVTHIPPVARRIGGPLSLYDWRVTATLLGCVTITFAAGGISGAYAWIVNGVTEFETGGRYPRFMMPMPVFIVISAVGTLLVGTLTTLLVRANLPRRGKRD